MKNNFLSFGYRFAISLVMCLSFHAKNHAQIVTTFAGRGGSGYNGDGIAATSAQLYLPVASAVDSRGNVYVCDHRNVRIRKITPSGIISTVAGVGGTGYIGDGGPATSAYLQMYYYDLIASIAIDSNDNIFFGSNGTIRKIDTSGIITTIAGSAYASSTADGIPATNALITGVSGIALDGRGNIYFTDNGKIRKINASGIISTFAGTGSTTSSSGDGGPATAADMVPWGIARNAHGEFFISDLYANSIRKIDTSGVITTIAGHGYPGFSGDGGPATAAQLNYPHGISLDHVGNIYIADHLNSRIRKINTSGIISTVAGNSRSEYNGDGIAATSASLNYAVGVHVDGFGNLIIADLDNNRVRRVDTAGIINTVAGMGHPGYSGDGGVATGAQLHSPGSIVFDRVGNLFIADRRNNIIRKITPSGIITTFAGDGSASTGGDGGPATAAQINAPSGLAVDTGGNLYVVEANGNKVRKITSSGIISTFAGSSSGSGLGDGGAATAASLYDPTSVSVDGSGNIYIADRGHSRVRKVNSSGIISTFAGTGYSSSSGNGGPATAATMTPVYVLNDRLGNLYITDRSSWSVRKVNAAGIIDLVAGGHYGFSGDGGPATSASFTEPYAIALDTLGNLFISDLGIDMQRIRKVNSSGIINTIIGNGEVAYAGDGGPASAAKIFDVWGMTTDVFGNLYFSEAGNNTVRKITYCMAPVVSSISGGTSLCIGSSLALADTASGGVWSSSSASIASINSSTGVVTGIAYGSAIMSYSVTNSCGTALATQTITVNPLPDVGTISGTDSVCPASAATLTSTIAGGSWSSSNTAIASINPTTGIVTGVAPGSVTILYIVTNICGSDTATHAFHVKNVADCPSAVNSLQSVVGSLQLYPNPNNGSFTLNLPSVSSEAAMITVTNLLGQKVKEFTLATNKEQMVKLNVPAGVYFVTAIIDGTWVSGKVVVQ